MHRIPSRGLRGLAFAISIVVCQTAFANRLASEQEMALIPYWCRATQVFAETKQEKENFNRMHAQYGEGWIHMHHYCSALVGLIRLSRPHSGISQKIETIIENMDYVLDRSSPGFPPRSEILATKARTQLRYTRPQDAEATARQLISEFPRFADGYTLLAESLLRTNRRDEARAALEEGAANVSDRERFEKQKSSLKLD